MAGLRSALTLQARARAASSRCRQLVRRPRAKLTGPGTMALPLQPRPVGFVPPVDSARRRGRIAPGACLTYERCGPWATLRLRRQVRTLGQKCRGAERRGPGTHATPNTAGCDELDSSPLTPPHNARLNESRRVARPCVTTQRTRTQRSPDRYREVARLVSPSW